MDGMPAIGGHGQTPAPVLRHTVTLFPQLDARRSMESDFALRAMYDLLAWDHLRATVGLSLSFTPVTVDCTFLDIGVDDIGGTGLGGHVKLMGNQYPEYGRAANTFTPYLAWRWAFVDLAFGVTWRWLVLPPSPLWWPFIHGDFMVESFFYYKIGVVLDLFDAFWTLSISLSNQDEFHAGNFGEFTLLVGNRINLDGRWSVFLDCLYRPSGTIALTAVNSELSLRLGGRLFL